MLEGWKEFTEIVAKEGKHILHSHLRMGTPKLEGNLIHLVFPNETIKIEMEREKYELLQFLRKKLQNYDVDLSIEVDEKEMKRYAYTTKEKYEKLVAINPLLEELRKTFDLDI
ncbi:hypothetical protein ULMA_26090 [Patiriisocius marinus]|uniref:DNA polymerase III subunit gamma/tau n=1 Tax=Patiriisocius marinus TaxID=1397112 RepID=A0A5J4J3V8_9FLAO|nr:hypothetical protein [Patiriisocius marinus]GER60501.1 hypothetical protein ULMA_26090 [Patiriisocius marinus]